MQDQACYMKVRAIKEFHSMVEESNGSEESVNSITKFCLAKNVRTQINEVDISKVLEDIIISRKFAIQLKLIVLQIITQILIDNTAKNYFKHLSPRIHLLISRENLQIQRQQTSVRLLRNLIQRWREKSLFTEAFIKRILETAGETLVEKMKDIDAFQFTKYTKTKLMHIQSVNRVQEASLIYKNFTQHLVLNERLQDITNRQKMIEEYPYEETRRIQAKQLLEQSDRIMEKYLQALMGVQKAIQVVSAVFQSEAEQLNLSYAQMQTQEI